MCCSLLLTSNRSVGSRSLPASLTKTSTLFLITIIFGSCFFSLAALSPTDPKSCELLCREWKAGHALPRGNALTTLRANRAAGGAAAAKGLFALPGLPHSETGGNDTSQQTTKILAPSHLHWVLQGHQQLSVPRKEPADPWLPSPFQGVKFSSRLPLLSGCF